MLQIHLENNIYLKEHMYSLNTLPASNNVERLLQGNNSIYFFFVCVFYYVIKKLKIL